MKKHIFIIGIMIIITGTFVLVFSGGEKTSRTLSSEKSTEQTQKGGWVFQAHPLSGYEIRDMILNVLTNYIVSDWSGFKKSTWS